MEVELQTERLRLRQWRDGDLSAFAAMNADPKVMENYPAALDRAASDALAAKLRAAIRDNGWGPWAVELRETGAFIGFIGLANATWEGPFTPCVEVGWRLAHRYWGHGYAPEGARASLRFGFETLGLDEIVAFTSPLNGRSQKVMHKIGMIRDTARDFEHPLIAEGHRLRPHILYSMTRARWLEADGRWSRPK